MRRRSDTLRENRLTPPIFDEKGYPRGKTQNETGEAVEASAFVPREASSALPSRLDMFIVPNFDKDFKPFRHKTKKSPINNSLKK